MSKLEVIVKVDGEVRETQGHKVGRQFDLFELFRNLKRVTEAQVEE